MKLNDEEKEFIVGVMKREYGLGLFDGRTTNKIYQRKLDLIKSVIKKLEEDE